MCFDSFYGLSCTKDAQVDTHNVKGDTPLMWASHNDHADVVGVLLKGGKQSKGHIQIFFITLVVHGSTSLLK